MTEPRPAVLRTVAEMVAFSEGARARGERIAFVPTMGYLHAGHVALLEDGRRRGDRLVLSIFVNPTQFAPTEDLARYPRDLEGDLDKAASAGTDVAFVPADVEMYPRGYQTFVQVRELEKGLCGAHRPGHFVGVATVVCKLFNIVRPHVAIFGEKDYQQLAVIRRMVADLDMPIEIVGLPTVREPDGLAMSSRNAYLEPSERLRATALSRALAAAEASAPAEGLAAALGVARAELSAAGIEPEYLEARDAEDLSPVTELGNRPVLIAIAARVGGARLIDNVLIEP
jgi:pantoate--beta-alanine ligase